MLCPAGLKFVTNYLELIKISFRILFQAEKIKMTKIYLWCLTEAIHNEFAKVVEKFCLPTSNFYVLRILCNLFLEINMKSELVKICKIGF